MNVPFVSLNTVNDIIKQRFVEKVSTLVDSGQFISGNEVRKFESNFATFNHNSFAIGVGNGLDALRISLTSLDIGQGDEVIVPAHTFIATWLAVSQTGATPIPVDADEKTYNINCSLIEGAITAKTKAIIPVHLYGQPCNMNAVMKMASTNNLKVVEDFAQAQGAKFAGKPVGSFGEINATSFYPAKNIGAAGDAGAITTNNSELKEKALLLRNYGSSKKYFHEMIGLNSRMDEIQAAFLNLKIEYLDAWNAERRKIVQLYSSNLESCAEVILPYTAPDAEHIFHLYVIRTDRRNELQPYLSSQGIDTGIHYPVPCHLQNAYAADYKSKYTLPVAENLADTLLSLPLFVGISDEEIDYVCEKIHHFFKK